MNSNFSITHLKNEPYDYYPLDTNAGYALLAEDHEIIVTPQTGQILLVNWERRRLVTDHLFTTQECAVLLPLLEAWPSYIPTDELFAELHEQREPSGQGMSFSHPRTVLSACQERLHSLGLDVIPVGEQGFLLVRFQGPNREEQGDLHEDQGNASARPAAREARD